MSLDQLLFVSIFVLIFLSLSLCLSLPLILYLSISLCLSLPFSLILSLSNCTFFSSFLSLSVYLSAFICISPSLALSLRTSTTPWCMLLWFLSSEVSALPLSRSFPSLGQPLSLLLLLTRQLHSKMSSQRCWRKFNCRFIIYYIISYQMASQDIKWRHIISYCLACQPFFWTFLPFRV